MAVKTSKGVRCVVEIPYIENVRSSQKVNLAVKKKKFRKLTVKEVTYDLFQLLLKGFRT